MVDGPGPGSWNMALDEALLIGARAGEWMLRFYRWRAPTVSLGYLQPWRTGFDVAVARQAGVALVRRPTGGRAVLHADELTYALVGPAGHGPLAGSVQGSYRTIAAGLVVGLARLGVEAKLVRTPDAPHVRDGACFNARARHEITVDSRKLIGSAQRRRNGALLQHGSVLVGRPDPRLWRALGEGGEAAAAASIGLQEVLGGRPCRRRLMRILADGVATALGLTVRWGTISAAERRLAAGLEARYRAPEWTQRL